MGFGVVFAGSFYFCLWVYVGFGAWVCFVGFVWVLGVCGVLWGLYGFKFVCVFVYLVRVIAVFFCWVFVRGSGCVLISLRFWCLFRVGVLW